MRKAHERTVQTSGEGMRVATITDKQEEEKEKEKENKFPLGTQRLACTFL